MHLQIVAVADHVIIPLVVLAISHVANAIVAMCTINAALIQLIVAFKSKSLAHADAAEWCHNTIQYKDAEWYLNITAYNAAATFLNIMMFLNADMLTESFANLLADGFLVTTGSVNAHLAVDAKLLAASHYVEGV